MIHVSNIPACNLICEYPLHYPNHNTDLIHCDHTIFNPLFFLSWGNPSLIILNAYSWRCDLGSLLTELKWPYGMPGIKLGSAFAPWKASTLSSLFSRFMWFLLLIVLLLKELCSKSQCNSLLGLFASTHPYYVESH